MMFPRFRVIALILPAVAALTIPRTGVAQQVLENVPELQRIDVVEHLGDTIPLDLVFTDDRGDPVTLRRYFTADRPVILTLAYSNCPMLCSIVLDGLTNGVQALSWRPGGEFQMITVSIDPLETVEQAAARKKRYMSYLPRASNPDGWAFLVGAAGQSRALADAVGFKYFWDEKSRQYAHPAVVMILTGDGVVSRYLYGIEYKERDLRLGLLEASEGKIGSTIDRIILYCFHYDPAAKGYVLFAGNVMRLGGLLTMVALVAFLVALWVRDRLHHRAGPAAVS
ncbi:MAG: SCO family protein [Candidatus Zixiibacteriota bacterium]